MRTLQPAALAVSIALATTLAAAPARPAATPAVAPPAPSVYAPLERGALVIEGIPEVPAAITDRLERYLETRSANFADWTGDGQILISTRFGNTAQVHRVAMPMGARTQLTFFKEPITGAAWNPDPARPGFVYSRDRGGDEFFQYWWYDATSGESRLLTDGKSRNTFFRWSNAGDRFVYASTRRDGVNGDLYIGALAGGERMLAQVAGSWSVLDWSPDDRQLLLSEYVSVADSRLYLADVATGTLTQLMPSETPVAYNGGARFGRDGKGVWFVSDRGSEFQRLRYFDFASGKETVFTANTPWDVGGVELSRDGRWLAWSVNEDGIEKVLVQDLKSGKPARLAALPVGVLGSFGFSPDSKRLAVTVSSARSAGDVFVYDLPAGKLTRWTQSEIGGLDPARLAEPTLVRFPTFDQVDGLDGKSARRIPAFVYTPALAAGQKAPVLISIHGGPESQAQPGFSALTQYYVGELGYAVVLPNVRGSTGYGKSFVALDDGQKREDSVKDIGALLDWIAIQPDLDATRVVVSGGSYGGYMVLASMVHFSDRLAGGVDTVGISHFGTFLKGTQSYRRDLRRAEYGDERDPVMAAFFDRISPLRNVERIGKPLFVIQGANDPRVPAGESRQMVDAVRARGVRTWYLLAKDEGHGFRKKANIDYQNAAIALFLTEIKEGR
jgi:dipeptidyl aminopeptidase/acylaminoacyl peptidase